MQAAAIIIAIIDILISIALILLVIFQEGHSGKSKGRSIDAKLKRFTTIAAIVFAVLTIVLYLLTGRS